MSETQDDLLPPNQEPLRYIPGQPLPRLWKTEPDPEDEEEAEDSDRAIEAAPPTKKKKKKPPAEKDRAAPAPRPTPFFSFSRNAPTSQAEKPKPKKKKRPADDSPKGEKKVLLEETPAFDTIESRQRARMAVGGLMVLCFLIMGWIAWGMLFPGSSDLGPDAGEMPASAMNPLPPGPAQSREPEARYMLDRARENAKAGKTEIAVAMLGRIVSVYKGTTAAAEAQAALDRPGQNLPLFPDRPFVLASKAAPPPATAKAAPPPPANAPPPSMTAKTGTPPAASAPPGPTTTPVPPNMPPPQVARAGTTDTPPSASRTMPPPGGQTPGNVGTPPAPVPGPGNVAANPPPGAATNPGASPSAPPSSPATTPGTGGSPPPSNPAMGPRVGTSNPPPGQPGVGATPPPSSQPPGPGPDAGRIAGTPGQREASTAQPGTNAPPPSGPGDVAMIIPGPGSNANVAPRPGGHPNNPPDTAPNRGVTTPGRPSRTLPPGFRAKPEAGYHESGWPMILVGERDNAVMVLVPGGTFTMGADGAEANSRPAHIVQLSTYYIDRHEVTNRQFRAFLDDTRYRGQPPGKWLTDPRLKAMPDDAPIVQVSYQDAEEYAIWALKRLPTEAQWEMAARSADGRRSPWGDEPPRWSHPRKLQQIARVMAYPEDVSPFGVFDMAGNAVEWVRDWYDPAYYARLRDKTTLDPTGPTTKRHGIQRVVKGVSKDWLMSARQGMDSDRRLPYVGFRCTLAVEGGEASAVITPHPVQPKTNQPGTPPPGQGAGNEVPF